MSEIVSTLAALPFGAAFASGFALPPPPPPDFPGLLSTTKWTPGLPGCELPAASLWSGLAKESAEQTSTPTCNLCCKYETFSAISACSSNGRDASRADGPNEAASSRLKAANGPKCLPNGFNDASCMRSVMMSFHCAAASGFAFMSSWAMSGSLPAACLSRSLAKTVFFQSGKSFATYTTADFAVPDFVAFSISFMKSWGTLLNM
mmetsp:Transcript_26515/g.49836  ORF Transcript_26515/g.49836 Transcript_26515/m.49836 type:complete len:205 (-) Transcript_26515:530-1144(-)